MRALQRRLYELGHGHGDEGDGGGRPGTGSSEEEGGGDLCLEAGLHRLLAQNRRAAEEVRQYGQVRGGADQGMALEVGWLCATRAAGAGT